MESIHLDELDDINKIPAERRVPDAVVRLQRRLPWQPLIQRHGGCLHPASGFRFEILVKVIPFRFRQEVTFRCCFPLPAGGASGHLFKKKNSINGQIHHYKIGCDKIRRMSPSFSI